MTEHRRPFSERIGAIPPPTSQVDDIDDALRNSLWNLLRLLLPVDANYNRARERALRCLARDFLKEALTTHLDDYIRRYGLRWFEEWFFNLPWFRVYDLLEFFANGLPDICALPSHDVIREANIILERERAGYRFVGGSLVPITNRAEVEAVETARAKASAAGLEGVREHLDAALRALSQKPTPDHRNAIKEAISAVEAATKLIGKTGGDGLASPLKELAEKTDMHPAMRDAFIKLYGWTSDAQGIRHALMEASNLDGADARFMVIACSAFVHFLIVKAEAAGLLKVSVVR